MRNIAVVVDTNSGVTKEDLKNLSDVYVVPMPFMINGEEYFEDVNLTQKDFYNLLENEAEISTSQPSIGQVVDLWESLLKDYKQIVHIPMSSALSQTCETAQNFAKDYEGKVFVVDNKRISVTLKQSMEDALKLIDRGLSGEEIKEYLEKTSLDSSIYIMVDTLKYLKRGGRITPAAAAIGTLLKIKPILQIQGGKLDSFAKVMNDKVARAKMISAIKKDLETRFKEFKEKGEMELAIAYTNCQEKAEDFARQVREEIPDVELKFIEPLSLSISCHIGPGALAVVATRVVR